MKYLWFRSFILLALLVACQADQEPTPIASVPPVPVTETPVQVVPTSTSLPATEVPTPVMPLFWNATHVISQTNWVHVLTFSPDGQFLAMQDQASLTTVFDLTRQALLWQKTLLKVGGQRQLVFTPDGQSLVVVQDSTLLLNSAIRILRITDGAEIASIERNHAIHGFAISQDGTLLATIGDGLGQVWNLNTRQELARFELLGGANVVAFDPSGQLLATGSTNGDLQFWNASSGQGLQRINIGNAIANVVFSPDGRWLAVPGYSDGVVRIIDLSRFLQITSVSINGHAVAFSPDSKFLATGGLDNILRLWRVESWQEDRQINQQGLIEEIAFDPNGQYLLSTTKGDVAELWDVNASSTGALFPEWQLMSAALSPDHHHIATGGYMAVHLWELGAVEQHATPPTVVGIVTPSALVTPVPAGTTLSAILVSDRSNDPSGSNTPIINSLVVTYDPTQWEYFAPERFYFQLPEPVMRHLGIPECYILQHHGGGLPEFLMIDEELVIISDGLVRHSLIQEKSGGKIHKALYMTPVQEIAVMMVGVAVEQEKECMQDAEALLATYEVLTRAVEP